MKTSSVPIAEPGPQARFAVYFCPAPDSPAGMAGGRWLGRSGDGEVETAQVSLPGVGTEAFRRLTSAPRRYGWHATLKAPFSLAQGASASELRSSVMRLARGFDVFEVARMKVALLDGFLAWVPDHRLADLDRLANRFCLELQGLAAPLTPADIARRRASPLSDRQDQLMLSWGYPHVLEQFRFHFSLTSALDGEADSLKLALMAGAKGHFGSLPGLWIDHVCLCVEPSESKDFVVLERFPLGDFW